MSRISTPHFALVLCLTLLCHTLPHARAAAPDAPGKGVKQDESCATCPAGSPGKRDDWVNSLATAGRRTQQMPFAPVQRSVFDGARVNLVGTANGSLVFAVTDLKVSGLMPLAFQRVYASDRAEDRGLGAGWSFAYDDRLRIDGDEAVLSTGAGAEIAFRREGQSRRFVLRTAEPGPHQSFEEAEDGTLTEPAAGLTRTYRRVGGDYRLASISDPNGNAISISFDRRGNISRVDGGGGRSLKLGWSAGKQRRLLSVADNAGRRISFESRGGSLAAVVGQAGSRWAYEYAGGRLVGASDPLGRVVLRARYDGQGRAVEAGDAVGSHRFEYEESGPGRTAVTDPLGAKTTFTHNALGAVSSITDDEGLTAALEYDEANRPARVSDSAGNQQTFAAEAGGKGGAAAAAGGATAYTYDARGNVLSARGGNPATSYRAVRNGRGQPLSLKAESGRELTFEYDAAGNRTALTYSDLGRFEKRFDEAGRKISERLPSGLSFDYEYDAHGGLASVTDSTGRARTIERDAGGLPARFTNADGKWVRATRDEAGRITRLDAADGRSRQFAYDARGALTYYRDTLGRQYRLNYDRRGRLQKIDKSDGVTLRYRYGRDGRIQSVSREGRESAPGFVRAGFNFSASRAAFRDFGEDGPMFDCFAPDGWWNYYGCDPCDIYCGDGMDWGTGSTSGGTGGSRDDCIRRELEACKAIFDACVVKATGVGIGIVVTCTTISFGLGFFFCLGVGVTVDLGGVYACWREADACELVAPNKCPA